MNEQNNSLRDWPAKDSQKSHLPPSSDRFVGKPKSLRPKSERPIEALQLHLCEDRERCSRGKAL